jgi:aminoglycoside phosphotransferase (APT) family kinase protein
MSSSPESEPSSVAPPVGDPRGIDREPVTRWLLDHIDGAVAPFAFDLIAGGRSNLTFLVTGADGTRFVLRRPPLGHVLATAHDMAREHRVIAAVGRTSVPVPPALGLCTDTSVNGAPFYVMGYVDGVVLDSVEKAEQLPIDLRRPAAEHLIDVLADLHAVDVDEVGLGDFAKREGYVERQVKRWSTQWENSKTRDLPAIDEVAAALRARLPQQVGVSIAHGDFRFGNCLTDVHQGRIAAVLDWELCTLGDPLADVGYLGVYWFDGEAANIRANDPTSAGGFPSYGDLLERYATRTGRDLSGIDYYVAFSCWRLAVISEGVYARYLHGAMGDQDVDIQQFKVGVEGLAERALAAVRRFS